jgi:hypothetical protein
LNSTVGGWPSRCLFRIVVMLLAVVGCGRDNQPDYVLGPAADIDETAIHPAQLRGDPVFSYQAVGRATVLAYQDSLLWIGDDTGDPFVHLINIRDATPIRSIGRRGDGPGDFHSVFGFSRRPGDGGSIWAFDISHRRLTRVAIDIRVPPHVVLLPRGVAQAVWLDRDRILAVGMSDTARLALLDSSGALLRHASGPLLGTDSVPLQQRLTASSQVKVCVKPDGTAFALFYMGGGRAELYDTLLRRGSELPVPFPSSGVFSRHKGDQTLQARSPRMYYVSCAATSTFLYAVFSGRHGDFEHHVVQANSRFVHVFDWGGHFIRAFRLDHDAMVIASDGDSAFYAMSVGSDTVHRYSLPHLTQSEQ